jgi:hypothetical protein
MLRPPSLPETEFFVNFSVPAVAAGPETLIVPL